MPNQINPLSQKFVEKDIMQDILSSQKHITGTYNTYANECVTPSLKSDFMNILNEEHQLQSDVFTEMQKRGWYTTEPADQNKMNQAKQKYQTEAATL